MTNARRSPIFLACVLSVLLGALLVTVWHTAQPTYALDTPAAKVDRGALLTIQNAFTSIAEEIKPSVVYITAERTVSQSDRGMPDMGDLFQGFPFGQMGPAPRGGQQVPMKSSGSGVIIRADGYILTNDHVVAGADRVTVTLDDGREFTGKATSDPRTDIAVVKIDAKNLPAAKLADSDQVKVGQWAIAVGSPFGLTNTLTVGVVSAVTREAAVEDPDMPGGARVYPELIQTDAAINPGNSGGPLINIDGQIIGVNTMIESPTHAYAGIGFAVPSNTVKFVVDQLIASGKVIRGQFGLIPRDISPAAAKTLGTDKGALVESVEDGSPADTAGIKPMDVILEIDGKKIDNSLALRRIVAPLKPDTTVPVVLLRDGKRETLKVLVRAADDQVSRSPDGKQTRLGMSVQELTPDLISKLGLPASTSGVMVKSVDAASSAGRAHGEIAPGDVITKINGQTVKSVAQFNKIESEMKSGDTALILIQRKDGTRIAELTLD